MKAIREFLNTKGCNHEGWDDDQARDIAKALGYTPPACRLEYYEPKKGGKPGMFLVIEAKGSRNSIFQRLCDGDELTTEARAKAVDTLTNVANSAADLVEFLS